jgi:hypothetical protein
MEMAADMGREGRFYHLVGGKVVPGVTALGHDEREPIPWGKPGTVTLVSGKLRRK